MVTSYILPVMTLCQQQHHKVLQKFVTFPSIVRCSTGSTGLLRSTSIPKITNSVTYKSGISRLSSRSVLKSLTSKPNLSDLRQSKQLISYLRQISTMANDHRILLPTFFCLTESDLSVPVYLQGELGRGDHVTWPRCCGYWHHAIIENGVDEHEQFDVIEMSSRYPCGPIVPSSETLSWPNNGGLYKMKYPSGVTALNPPEKVLERAREETENQSLCNVMTNNCEHLATYCKTGDRQSLQIERGCCHAPCYNFIKIICLLLYIIAIAFLYECMEIEIIVRDGWIGFVFLPLSEVVRRLFTIAIIIFHDIPKLQRWFDEGDLRRARCCDLPIVCRAAIIRKLVKSLIIVSFMEGALLLIRFVKPLSELRNQQSTLVLGCLDVTAVVVGSILGSILFYWYCHMIPWHRCSCLRPNDEATPLFQGMGFE